MPSFEDQILDRMRSLHFTVDHYDVESIFDEVDRFLPDEFDPGDMDRRTFVSIVDRNIW